MFFRVYSVIILVVFLSCLFIDDNPLDESGSGYIPPTIVVDSSSVKDGDTIKGSTALLGLSGNAPENQFRVRIKNGVWSPWFDAGFYTLDSLSGGFQVIELCARYVGGDYYTYDSITIFVIEQIIDTLSSDSDTITITDTISISDSMKISYTVKVTDIVLVVGELGLPDSGNGMSGIDLSGMDLSGIDLSGMDLSGMDLSGLLDTVRIIDTIIDTIRVIDTLKVLDTTETDTTETDTTETDTTETDTTEIDTTEIDTTEIDTIEINNVEKNLYSVIYDGKGNDGGVIPVDTIKYSTGSVVLIMKGEPLLILHEFIGWKYSDSGEKKIYKERDTLVMGKSNVILEAQWESLPSFLIELDGNGSTSEEFPFSIFKLKGEVFYIPIISPVKKDGYVLSSWNTDKNGKGTKYNPGDKIRIEGNLILYAQWEKIQGLSLKYICEDCSKEEISEIIINNSDTVIIIDSVTYGKTGYSFKEWNTSKEGNGKGYKVGDTIIIKDKNIKLYAQWGNPPGMVLIPSKDKIFVMGGFMFEVEWPRRDVKFTKDIWFDSVEVTRSSFNKVMKEVYPDLSEYYYSGRDKDKPVNNVNWYGAILYCNARTRLTNSTDTVFKYTRRTNIPFVGYELTGMTIDMNKRGFRLPSEAEWEYAARGEVIVNNLNDDEIASMGWYVNNSDLEIKAVARKNSNAFNLYDMLGNVSEWTMDWYYPYKVDEDTTIKEIFIDPINLKTSTDVNTGRIHRGGNITYGSNKATCSYREYSLPSTSSTYIGFRCCLPID